MRTTFSRTPNGLRNYNIFYNAEIMVYTEGRCLVDQAIEDKNAYDTKYYESLVRSFTDYKKIKILLVGNKINALDYYKKIIDNNINNSIVFIDKDYDGVFNSIIKKPRLLTTYGYSWENDLWTKELCKDVIYNISMRDEEAVYECEKKFLRCVSRLDKISRLNAAAQFFGLCILPNSKSKSKGLKVNGTREWPVLREEFGRLKKTFISKLESLVTPGYILFIKNALAYNKVPPNFIIQGHLFEHAMLILIGECYKFSSKKKTYDPSMVKNIAFSIFDQDVKHYLTGDALKHYSDEFSRI